MVQEEQSIPGDSSKDGVKICLCGFSCEGKVMVKSGRNGKDTNRCNDCAHTIKRYGLTKRNILELLQIQGGICKICNNPLDISNAVVDHCHNSSEVRGILCNGCNSAIGHLRENVSTAERVITYLKDNSPIHL